jgi:LCP family protein required for cell wall assembly
VPDDKKDILPIYSRPSVSPQNNTLLNRTIPGSPSRSPLLGSTNQPSHKKFKKHNKKRITLYSVLVVVLVVIGLGSWQVWQDLHKFNHLAVGNLRVSVGGTENILVAGSTNRCNLSVQNAQWGFCSQGVTGVNSDIIFIAHLVPKTHTITVLSIPRDTFIPNARAGDQAFKIDAALYEGPTQLVNAVEEDFGISIQHYAELGFDGFVNIVNAVGGIKLYFPEPVFDAESYLNVQTPGCYQLNGVQALQVVRARHLQYKPPSITTNDHYYWPQEVQSDIARIARTHEFLRVLASTVVSKGFGNPITDQNLLNAIAPQVQVDSGFSTSVMLQLADEFRSVNFNSVRQYTLPVSTTIFGSYYYNGLDYGDVTFPSESIDQQVINEFLGVSNSTDTMTGNPLPSPNSINVSIVNGSGVSGQGSQTSSSLQALGFNVVGQTQDTTPPSSQTLETVVAYSKNSTEADAEAVARQLTGPVILSQNSSLVRSGSEVTVVTGSSATSSNSMAAAGLATPNQSVQPLAAWDPRACTPNQKVIVNPKV